MKNLFFCGLVAISLSSAAQAQFGTPEQSSPADSTAPFRQPPDTQQSPLDRSLSPNIRDLFRPDGNLRQPVNPWDLRPAIPPRPRGRTALPNQRWDFRFDAQYQSTVKPYLRWYMRYDPENPGQRYLPRSYTEGYGEFGQMPPIAGMLPVSQHCDTCGTSPISSQQVPGYGVPMDGYGHPARSIYWQHLDYLYYRYGGTPIRATLPTSRSGSNSSGTTYSRGAMAATSANRPAPGKRTRKTVWVALNPTTSSFSILFVAPPNEQADRFYRATALVHNRVRIIGLTWEDTEPEWARNIEVADGSLKIRDES